jgi:hypothetical protein
MIATNRPIVMAWPGLAGLPRLSLPKKKNVDVRDKRGHDVEISPFQH